MPPPSAILAIVLNYCVICDVLLLLVDVNGKECGEEADYFLMRRDEVEAPEAGSRNLGGEK